MDTTANRVLGEYTGWQVFLLVSLRVLIGWHFLYEGVSKLFNPNWTSVGYLLDSQGPLGDFFHALAAHPGLLNAVDFLNVWGLVLIGLGLILGMFTRVATVAGMALLLFYYASHPPLTGLKYAIPTEGSYLVVDKNLIEMVALGVLLVFPTGSVIGVDRLISRLFRKKQHFSEKGIYENGR